MTREANSPASLPCESSLLLMESVEKKINEICSSQLSTDSLLLQSMQHQLRMGGRRTRSLLALQISAILNISDNDSIALASACELLHQASLVHDDIQDEHPTRRGHPTVWNKFGKDYALCVGDFLLSAAYVALTDCENVTRLKDMLLATHSYISTVISGQCEDILGRAQAPSIQEYERMVLKKSGSLLELPLHLAITYKGTNQNYDLQYEFFKYYTLVYQSIDDLEDYHDDWVKSSAIKSPNLLAMMYAKYQNMELARAAAHTYIHHLFERMESISQNVDSNWHHLLSSYANKLHESYLPKKKSLASKQSAIVIGGGFGGIAAALRLAAKGYEVELIEKLGALGGRAQVYVKDGFRHDAGPTVITAPFLFEELFALFGKKMSDYIELRPIEPWYRFVFADGKQFNYGGTLADTLAEIERFNPADQQGYLNLLSLSKSIYSIGFEKLADQPFHKWVSMLKSIPHLIRLKSYRTVWQLVSGNLKDPYLRQVFSIQPLLVGGNPFSTTCIYNLIHYLERQWGVTFAMGGTGALVAALTRLLDEAGVKITLNSTVEKILIANQKVEGVQIKNGKKIASSLVISNADPAYCYSNMIDTKHQKYITRLKTKKSQFSMGLFVLYFGTTRVYPEIAHHTIWMGERYQSLLTDIFDKKILSEDFSMYLHRPTATDPSFAPKGCDSFYVLVPVPNLQGDVDWAREAKPLQARIVAALSKTILPDLEKYIVADFYKTPEDFENDYLSLHGAGFSIAPIFKQSAWFRYHNRAEGISGLYHVGAGTHPGAGLPGVLSSAKVIDNLINAAVPCKQPETL